MPGDKSISHRALLTSALARGKSELRGLNFGADVVHTLTILRQLGIKVNQASDALVIQGSNFQLYPPKQILDCGNSGTTMRLLGGLLSGQNFTSILDGDLSLRTRPMARIMDPLRLMGAKIAGNQGSFSAPLTISGGNLEGIHYELPVASAQVKSALIYAGLQAQGTTTIVEPTVTRDHTERMLSYCGVPLFRSGETINIPGCSPIHGQNHKIPGDFSSAAYLIAATLALPGSELVISNVGLNPTRLGFLEVLGGMGADFEIVNETSWGKEPVGDLFVRGSSLTSTTVKGGLIPQLIDEIPILAVLATQAAGETKILDAGELRHKESDRLSCLTSELSKLGAQIVELPEGLIITGPTRLSGGKVNSYGDHRLALAFQVASLLTEGQIQIVDKKCGEVSYPGFAQSLQRLIVG